MGARHFFCAAAACALIVTTSLPAGAVAAPSGSLSLLTGLTADDGCSLATPNPSFKSTPVAKTAKSLTLRGTFKAAVTDQPYSDIIKLTSSSSYQPVMDGRFLKSGTISGKHQIEFSRTDAVCNAALTATTNHYLTFPVRKAGRLQISWDNAARARLFEAIVFYDGQIKRMATDLPKAGKFTVKVTPGKWAVYVEVDTTLAESEVPVNGSRTVKAPFTVKARVS